MTLTQVKNSLIAYAHSKGRPEYSIFAVREVHAAIQNGIDHPLKDLVIRMNPPPVKIIPRTQEQRRIEQINLRIQRQNIQMPLLKKYRDKYGRGCFSVLAKQTNGIATRQQLYKASIGQTTLGDFKWDAVKKILDKEFTNNGAAA